MKTLKRSVAALLSVSLFAVYFLNRVNAYSEPAGVLLGPCSSAYAEGPTGTNDDFSNLNIGGRPVPSSSVTSSPATAVFRNTVENTGARDDAFNISVASMPAGFTAEISTDFGAHYVALNPSSSANVPVSYRASMTFFLRVTAPAGLKLLTSFDTIVRATSTLDPPVFNETIDRIYTGFVRVAVAWKVIDSTGAHDFKGALPGSELECQVTYMNISSGAGSGNEILTAQNIVISEGGRTPPNNWGDTSDHVVGATDTRGGYILGDREGSTCLTDTINTLRPGESGLFKFRRRVR
jgi:hypothetical protein